MRLPTGSWRWRSMPSRRSRRASRRIGEGPRRGPPMTRERDRLSRAGSFVLGLMDDADRRRAERGLKVDPVFREAVLELAERLQVLDIVPQKDISGAELWDLIAARIAALPQMRGVVEGGIAPAENFSTIGRGREQFQEKWEPVFRPELRKDREQFQEKWEPVFRPELRKNNKQFQEKREPIVRPVAPYAMSSRQVAVYTISFIAAFAAGYLAAIWLM